MTFEQFVAVQGAPLLRLAFVLTGDRHLAEDLAQTERPTDLPDTTADRAAGPGDAPPPTDVPRQPGYA